MNTKHTPEPWHHHAPSGSQHCMGGYINASEERGGAAIVHVCGSEFSEDEYRANARRIVACVNACQGLPTDELEQKGLVAELLDLEQQRDGLCDAIGLAITIVSELANDENLSGHMKGTLTGLAEGLRMRVASARGEQ